MTDDGDGEGRALGSIAFEEVMLAECRHGRMLWPRSDATIGRCLELYGEFAEAENSIMASFLSHGDTAIDVGANLGTTALPMGRRVGASGTVLAFEPQPLMAQLLSATLTLNEVFNVRVLSMALGNQTGWAAIPELGIHHGGNYGAVRLAPEGIRVPIVRLDDWHLPRCDLIKIDVEGNEWSVIEGARSTLSKHRPVLYVEAKRTIPETKVWLAFLLGAGWRCYWHFATFYRKDNFRAQQKNVFGGMGDMNVLAVPREKEQIPHLPEIATPTEDWRDVYEEFFRVRGIALP